MRYLLIVVLLTSCSADFDYPNPKKERSNYNLHGTTVIDPYKYMEDFYYSENKLNQSYEHLLTFNLNMLYLEYWKKQFSSKIL